MKMENNYSNRFVVSFKSRFSKLKLIAPELPSQEEISENVTPVLVSIMHGIFLDDLGRIILRCKGRAWRDVRTEQPIGMQDIFKSKPLKEKTPQGHWGSGWKETQHTNHTWLE